MTDFPKRKLHRLKNYDYSQNGYYFVTVCTKDRQKLLSNVGNAVPGVPPKVELTEIGQMVKEVWTRMAQIDLSVKIDEFCIMPNHIHGIIIIENDLNGSERRGRRSLHSLVAGFKSVTTRKYNTDFNKNEKKSLWQASFFDEIIKNEEHLHQARKYIMENHFKWTLDKYY